MHIRRVISARRILIAACGMASQNVYAKAPEILAPVKPWIVDYAAKKCMAARTFGSGKSAITLLLEQYGPGDYFNLTMIGNRFSRWSETEVPLRFGPNEQWQTAKYFTGNFGKANDAILFTGSRRVAAFPPDLLKAWKRGEFVEPSPVSSAQLAAVRSLDVRRLGREIQLATGRLDKLFVTLAKCNESLVKSWGFDPSVMAAMKQGPKPLSPPSKWLGSDDYPPLELRKGARSIVMMRVNVDEAGSVTACEVQQGTNGDEFAKAVCGGITKRAKFSPALNSEGRPIAAYWRNTVIFAFPNSVP